MFWFTRKRKSQGPKSKEDQKIQRIFKRYGNKMTMEQLKYRISRVPFQPYEREYRVCKAEKV